MKVKCIKDAFMSEFKDKVFSEGETYKIIDNGRSGYCVMDDCNDRHWISGPGEDWFDEHFEVIE